MAPKASKPKSSAVSISERVRVKFSVDLFDRFCCAAITGSDIPRIKTQDYNIIMNDK